MQANFERASAALSATRTSLMRLIAAGAQQDLCTTVGRFSGKSVKVTIRATPVPSGDVTAAVPGARSVATSASADNGAPPAANGPSSSPGSTKAADDGVLTSEVTFDAYAPTHVHVKLGVVASSLDDPEFKLESVTANCPQGQQCLKPFVATANDWQVRPVTHVSLYLGGRYLWAVSDPGDPYENAQARRFVPYPTFGFSLTDTTENYFVGGGVEIARGVGLLAGVHLGKVGRLRPGFAVGTEFQRAAGGTIDIGEIVDTGYHAGTYVSLSVDIGTVSRIFNLSNGER